MVFNHSIKVPTQYKKAAKVIKQVICDNKSVKSIIYQENHAKIPNLLALINKYAEYKNSIETVIEKSNILVDNPRLDPYLCRVLITELLIGTKKLIGESKPVTCVISYKNILIKLFEELEPSKHIPKVEKPRYIRINTNLLSVENAVELLEKEDWIKVEKEYTNYDDYITNIKNLKENEFMLDIHVPDLLIFNAANKSYWAGSTLVTERKFMLQDKGTCLVSKLLNPPSEAIVLDMCAAPGMKTIHLSNIMKNKGKIFAVEQNISRYDTLCNMVKDANATSVKTINADILAIKSKDVPGVNYILLDPSCSGSGIQNRITLQDGYTETSKDRLKKLANLQKKMLFHAMESFPDVQKIVYSTCSINKEENEEVVQGVLSKNSDFKLLNAKKILDKKWKNVGDKDFKGIGKHCLYSLPDDLTDGIFMAVFERKTKT